MTYLVCDYCGYTFSEDGDYAHFNIRGMGDSWFCSDCMDKVSPHLKVARKTIVENNIFFVKDEDGNLVFVESIDDLESFENVMIGAYPCNKVKNVTALNRFHGYERIPHILNGSEKGSVIVCWKNGYRHSFDLKNGDLVDQIKRCVVNTKVEHMPFLMASDKNDSMISTNLVAVYSLVKSDDDGVWANSIIDLLDKLSLNISEYEYEGEVVMDTCSVRQHLRKVGR